MEKEIILTTRGDSIDLIDNLIETLQEAKNKGATHYNMRWSQDPNWAFKWFELYRVKTDAEVNKEKIDKLKQQIKQLEEKGL